MQSVKRTFRVFISSTFTDMRKERGILQAEVFPKLKKFCEERGAFFQAIDLRWGVNEESQLEQKTMDICLSEITRCQKISPRPNFILLLGDRYGWQPIPDKIPASEIIDILDYLSDNEKSLLAQWYKKDKNAVPPEYVLQPRGERYEDYGVWQTVEDNLRTILRNAVDKTTFSSEQRIKYFTSATHQEIINGAMLPSTEGVDPTEHVFAYLRTIGNLSQDNAASDFVDLLPDGTIDPYAQRQMDGLKKDLHDKLSQKHVYSYPSQWDDGVQFDDKSFADRVYDNLSFTIEKELQEIVSVDELTREKEIHAKFRDRLTEFFTGQEDTIRQITSYINKGGKKSLALIGPSGSGKSSIMAQVIHSSSQSWRDRGIFPIFRFIGVTSASSNLNTLLSQLCEEMAQSHNMELKALLQEDENEEKLITYDGLSEIFLRCVNLASEEKPLILFLDALDQLQTPNYDFLNFDLPDHVRIIVSALPELQNKLTFADVLVLPLMEKDTGEKLLGKWLFAERRSLTKGQSERIIGKFEKNGLPIYLKLAFEQARNWHSYDRPKAFHDDVESILASFFDFLEKSHTKQLVSHVIGYLLSGKYFGLTETEVLDILSYDNSYWQGFLESCHPAHRAEVGQAGKLPVVVWSRLFLDLEPYLTERDADGVKIITFHHRIFLEYARKRYFLHHRTIADYFEKELPLYVNEKEKIPNIRKVVEQPYQQTHGGEWNGLEKTLTDLFFIEAKCIAGMVFDLLQDFDLALTTLPEGREGARKKGEYEERARHYSQKMIDYARAWEYWRNELNRNPNKYPILTLENIHLPEPIASICPWTDEEIEEDTKRILKKPTRLDRINSYLQFVGTEVYNLVKYSSHPGFCIQQAYNSADSGPVAENAQEIVRNNCSSPLLLQTDSTLPKYNPHRACIRTLEGHTAWVHTVSITSDGRFAISGSWDKTIRVWDIETGACIRTLEGHNEYGVDAVSITLDGRFAISVSHQTLSVWEIETGACIRSIEGYMNFIQTVSENPDGMLVVSGETGEDYVLRVCDIQAGAGTRDERYVSTVSITSDGSFAVSWGKDNTFCVWDIETNSILDDDLREIRAIGDLRGISAVSITPDRRLAVSAGGYDPLRVWDIETGACIHILEGQHEERDVGGTSVSITPDGKFALSVSYSSLCVWDIETGVCIKTLEGHTNFINTLSITPDGRLAISGSSDKTLRVWDIATGICIKTLEGHTDKVFTVSITPDGRYAVSGSKDKTVRIWDIETGVYTYTKDGQTEYNIESLDTTPNGKLAVSESSDQSLHVWEIETGALIRRFEGSFSPASILRHGTVNITPDGRFAVCGRKVGTIDVWDIETGAYIRTIGDFFDKVSVDTVNITPDGRFAVSGSSDNNLHIWNIETGICIRTLEGHTSNINTVSITPDGRFAICGCRDAILRVWDIETGVCIHTLEGHRADTVCITPDGRSAIFSGGRDTTLRVWDIETGACIRTLEENIVVNTVNITPDGRFVVSGGADGTLRIWDIKTGKCHAISTSNVGKINSIALGKDNLHVMGGASGKLYFFRIENLEGGIPFATPSRIWQFSGQSDIEGTWDNEITTLCQWCRERFLTNGSILEAINDLSSQLPANQSTCLSLPSVAWEDPRLLSECPCCQKPIRYNPFIVDNRDKYNYLFEAESEFRNFFCSNCGGAISDLKSRRATQIFCIFLFIGTIVPPFYSLWWLFLSVPLGFGALRDIKAAFDNNIHQCIACGKFCVITDKVPNESNPTNKQL